MQTVLMIAAIAAVILAMPFIALQRFHVATGLFLVSAVCSTSAAFVAQPFFLTGLAFAVVAVLTIVVGVVINPQLFLRLHTG